MKKWVKINLGKVCSIAKGEQLNKTELNNSSDYPCINGGISPSGYTEKWNSLANTITISEGGNSCGYVNFIKTKFWSGGHCYSLLDIKDFLNKNFLYYALKGREESIMKLRVGTGLPNIQRKDINDFEFLYPVDKNEQIIINHILSTIDKNINLTQSLIAKYENIITGLMQDLLTRGIDDSTGKIRPIYDEAPELYKASENGWIPKDWKTHSILETTYLKGRIGWQGLRADEFIEIGPHLVTGTDFNIGKIDWDNCYRVSKKRYDEAKYIQLKNGDVLITKDGTIGKTAYVTNCPKKAVLNSGVFLMRCKNNTYYNKFMYYLLNSSVFDKFLYKSLGGSTIVHLYQREFEKFKFPCPQKTEQKLIINKIDGINNLLFAENENHSKLNMLKSGLMQDLLSGKVPVNHLVTN